MEQTLCAFAFGCSGFYGNHREKRLILHSDTDIATEVLKMTAEIASLTATINTANKEISDLKTTLSKVTNNGE